MRIRSIWQRSYEINADDSEYRGLRERSRTSCWHWPIRCRRKFDLNFQLRQQVFTSTHLGHNGPCCTQTVRFKIKSSPDRMLILCPGATRSAQTQTTQNGRNRPTASVTKCLQHKAGNLVTLSVQRTLLMLHIILRLAHHTFECCFATKI